MQGTQKAVSIGKGALIQCKFTHCVCAGAVSAARRLPSLEHASGARGCAAAAAAAPGGGQQSEAVQAQRLCVADGALELHSRQVPGARPTAAVEGGEAAGSRWGGEERGAACVSGRAGATSRQPPPQQATPRLQLRTCRQRSPGTGRSGSSRRTSPGRAGTTGRRACSSAAGVRMRGEGTSAGSAGWQHQDCRTVGSIPQLHSSPRHPPSRLRCLSLAQAALRPSWPRPPLQAP